jgi:hypothetical protein
VLIGFGPIRETIDQYTKLASQEAEFTVGQTDNDAEIRITAVRVTDRDGQSVREVPHDEPFQLSISLDVKHLRRGAMLCVALLNKYKRRVFTEHKSLAELVSGKKGEHHIAYEIPKNFIAPNGYSFLVQVFYENGLLVHDLFDICPIEIIDVGSEMAAYRDYGYVIARGSWKICKN